ncbi:TPA: hypothetical protein PXM28_003433 [Yersinia enterocolitica]|nr:hypothetical protein [Yersinia enterocolitica]
MGKISNINPGQESTLADITYSISSRIEEKLLENKKKKNRYEEQIEATLHQMVMTRQNAELPTLVDMVVHKNNTKMNQKVNLDNNLLLQGDNNHQVNVLGVKKNGSPRGEIVPDNNINQKVNLNTPPLLQGENNQQVNILGVKKNGSPRGEIVPDNNINQKVNLNTLPLLQGENNQQVNILDVKKFGPQESAIVPENHPNNKINHKVILNNPVLEKNGKSSQVKFSEARQFSSEGEKTTTNNKHVRNDVNSHEVKSYSSTINSGIYKLNNRIATEPGNDMPAFNKGTAPDVSKSIPMLNKGIMVEPDNNIPMFNNEVASEKSNNSATLNKETDLSVKNELQSGMLFTKQTINDVLITENKTEENSKLFGKHHQVNNENITDDPGKSSEKLIYRFQQWGHNHSVVISQNTEGAMIMKPSDDLVEKRLNDALRDNSDTAQWQLDQNYQDRKHSRQEKDDDEDNN